MTPFPSNSPGLPRHSRLILLLSAVVLLLSIWRASRLRPVGTLEALLDRQDPAARALGAIIRDFEVTDTLLVLVTASSDDRDAEGHVRERLDRFADRLIEATKSEPDLSALGVWGTTELLPQLDAFVREVIAPRLAYYLDEHGFREFLDRLSPSGLSKQMIRNEGLIGAPGPSGQALGELVLRDPLHLHEIILNGPRFKDLGAWANQRPGRDPAPGPPHRLIRIIGSRPASDLEYAVRLTGAFDRTISRLGDDRLRITVGGAYAIAAFAQSAIRRDMIVSIVSSVILLFLLFLIVLGRIRIFLVALTPVVLGISMSFAAYSLWSASLTPIVAVIGGLLSGLAIDYGIHLLLQHEDYAPREPTGLTSLFQAPMSMTRTVVAAAVTSVSGFLVLTTSGVQAIREFALLGAAGLTLSALSALVLIPVMRPFLLDRRESAPGRAAIRLVPPALIGMLWTRGPKFAGLSMGLAMLPVLYIGVSRGRIVSFETDMHVMHPMPNPPLRAQEEIAQIVGGGSETLLVHLVARDSIELVRKSHLVADRLARSAALEAHSISSIGLCTLLPDPNVVEVRRSALRGIDASRVLGDFEEAVSRSPFEPTIFQEYRDFLERILTPASAPDLDTLRSHYGRLSATVLPRGGVASEVTGAQALQMLSVREPLRDRTALHELIVAIRGALIDVPGAVLTGLPVLGEDVRRSIRADLGRFSVETLILVGGLILLLSPDRRRAPWSLVPPVFAFAFTTGMMSLTGDHLNLINLIAAPILIGVGVDSGLFTLRAAVEGQGVDTGPDHPPEALIRSCQAVALSSVTTAVTFGTLVLTGTPAIQSLGRIMVLGVVGNLMGTFLVLLPLLGMNRRSTGSGDLRPKTR